MDKEILPTHAGIWWETPTLRRNLCLQSFHSPTQLPLKKCPFWDVMSSTLSWQVMRWHFMRSVSMCFEFAELYITWYTKYWTHHIGDKNKICITRLCSQNWVCSSSWLQQKFQEHHKRKGIVLLSPFDIYSLCFLGLVALQWIYSLKHSEQLK